MTPPDAENQPGFAFRHETWNEVTTVSTIGRRTLSAVPNYRLLKAATRIDASAGARLLLVHLIGYLGNDDPAKPASRFVVFPGNTRLSDELRCTPRSIQRQADELEAKGYLRRCYNGMNRRTGFDLTPFAAQHEAVTADIVAIQTERKQRRSEAQLELGLAADRITRPDGSMTPASSQGDASVTHNRTENNNSVGRSDAAVALDAIFASHIANDSADDSVAQDRTEDRLASMLVHVTTVFTGHGRTAHLGWNSAIQALGASRAVGLFLTARDDPRRRATPERYFSWLLRAYLSGDTSIVTQAATRAATASRSKPAAPFPTTCDPIRDAVRDRIGARMFDSWLASARIIHDGDDLTVQTASAFTAEWIERNLGEDIAAAAADVSGHPVNIRFRSAA